MKTQIENNRLYREAMALLERAQKLLDAALAKHEARAEKKAA